MKNFCKNSANTPSEAIDFQKVNYFTIAEDGQRLDNFLLTLLKGVPRAHVYKLIRDKEITLNKKRAKPHQRLQAGDVVRVAPVVVATRQAPVIGAELITGLLEKIQYEDESILVLDKPFGLAVHGGSGVSAGVIEIMRKATQKPYLELVHRIDKDTSGLLVIAKKRSALKALQEKFRQKTVQKQYLCVCLGDVRKTLGGDTGFVDKPLLRYTLANGERRVKVHKEGKPSHTDIVVLGVFVVNDCTVSLVQASPKTGRTHQIRVHLASIGHALLGDSKYATHPNFVVSRLYLHAWTLDFGNQRFVAHVPKEFRQLLDGQWDFDDNFAF